MAILVKKVGKRRFYEIDNYRAGGLIPYKIVDNNMFILINKELRNKKIIRNCLGGKVEKSDKDIESTIIREFNEESGFLISDKKKIIYEKILKTQKRINISNSKYMGILYKIPQNDLKIWNDLPYLYNRIFKNIKLSGTRESLSLEWININDLSKDINISYILSLVLANIKRIPIFKKYVCTIDDYEEPLFV